MRDHVTCPTTRCVTKHNANMSTKMIIINGGRIALIFFLTLAATHVATLVRDTTTDAERWQNAFLDIPTAEETRRHLQYYTSIAHSAGDYETAVYTHERFLEYGFNSTILEEEVLLSYPIQRRVTLLHPVFYEAKLKEASYSQDDTMHHPDVMDTFNGETPYDDSNLTLTGYSPSGNVTAEVVYVNYGSRADFDLLLASGVELTGKIALARYGGLFRGTKAMIAQESGMIGLLIYSDPIDDGGNTFPDGPYRPTTGVQRGSVQFLSICPGDPRRQVCQPDDENYTYEKGIPSIPVQPISFEDALPILQNLGNHTIPRNMWQGAANNTHVGPGPAVVNLFLDVKFNVTTIWNVVGTIPGTNPTETVLLGNHRDAWVFGAVDPNSGSSALLATARAFGVLYRKGWRPKRNIVFASWDGEEYGLLGSTAYAERKDRNNDEVVAYINMDTAVSGTTLDAAASPSLEKVFRKVLEKVKDPNTGTLLSTLFQSKKIRTLGSGSDYTSLLDHFGVPSLDFSFDGHYGVYHSVYDDFYWMSHYGDPTFEYHRAAAQIFGLVAMEIAESDTAALDFVRYSERLEEYYVETLNYVKAINSSIDMNELKDVIEDFKEAAEDYDKDIQKNSQKSELYARATKLERAFIGEIGLPGRPYYRHVIQAPGLYEGYGSSPFPGLMQTSGQRNWKMFDRQYRLLVERIEAATLVLEGK
ncbi:putative aminopeptidase [Planoprotostelium fungivorum]|uniref:Putative aminopeptidase n=1 Tax=Planoprotostelium fungivorum TaxID=1890364 RepID=A0A2P6NPF6_9EUKA|nr:putative aminopeptidase [Planoprotostelium fungivorum]